MSEDKKVYLSTTGSYPKLQSGDREALLFIRRRCPKTVSEDSVRRQCPKTILISDRLLTRSCRSGAVKLPWVPEDDVRKHRPQDEMDREVLEPQSEDRGARNKE